MQVKAGMIGRRDGWDSKWKYSRTRMLGNLKHGHGNNSHERQRDINYPAKKSLLKLSGNQDNLTKYDTYKIFVISGLLHAFHIQ